MSDWWTEDPVTITGLDENGCWRRHPLPWWMRDIVGDTRGDIEQIADACAFVFGREPSWISTPLWVRMCNPITYAATVAMPLEVNERVARAVGTFERNDAFELGEEFRVLGAIAPKLPLFKVHQCIPQRVAELLSRELVRIRFAKPKPVPDVTPPDGTPRQVIRSAGPPNRERPRP